MKITKRKLRRVIREAIDLTRRERAGTKSQTSNEQARALLNDLLLEGEVVGFPHKPSLPWEFGPKGYLARHELKQKMSDLEYGSDSPPEWILAIALSNRAEEMGGYKQAQDPEKFRDLGMRLYQDYVVGKAGNIEQSLHDITSRIDAGDYFDEDIEDVMGPTDPIKSRDAGPMTGDLGHSSEVADMDLDFDKYLQGIESGKVVDIDEDR